jgi:uncharacterized membrane protein YqjE
MEMQHRTPTSTDESVKDLLSEATKEFNELLRKEVELAKTEVKEQASRAGKAVAMFAGMGLLGFMAFLLVSFAAAWGLAEGVPTGLAFLAVGLLYGAIGGLLFVQGRKRLKEVEPPQATIQTIKEDIQVAKSALSAGASGGGGSNSAASATGYWSRS